MSKLMENYNKALQDLYDHVGFTPDWVVCPIDDCTDTYWEINDGEVEYAESIEEFRNEEGNYYVDEIYTQRFYDKHVFIGNELTMAMCDPHVDGVQWFRFFDNSKRMSNMKG